MIDEGNAQQRQPVLAALEAVRRGRVVLVSDPRAPERGGVLIAAAERTSDDIVNFMALEGCGLVSIGLLPERLERLGLAALSPTASAERENYTISVEAKDGVTTGISAADRARTIQVLIAHDSRADDLIAPGHVFPAAADPGGVIARRGWAEAGVDLVKCAGLRAGVTFCEVLGADGDLATGDALVELAARCGLPHVGIDDILAHRMATETFVTQLHQTLLPTAYGEFVVRAFENRLSGRQHLALSVGAIRTPEPILVRVHSECLTGDVFGSRRCDCGGQLAESMQRIREAGRGVLLYLRQEGRGIGLANKVRAYQLQDAGRDTVEANEELGLPADSRDYTVAAQMLLALGVHRVRLMTNNPRKIDGLVRGGVMVTAREGIEQDVSSDNHRYLTTKKAKLGHMLDGL